MHTISLDNYPSNIAVFEAINMSEALLQADKVLKKEHIQGAVWAASPNPCDIQKEETLRHAYQKACGHPVSSHTQDWVQIIIKLQNDQFNFGFDGKHGNASNNLTRDRKNNMRALSTYFSTVQLSVRHERAINKKPHLDGDIATGTPFESSKLFGGKRIRILNARLQAGTLVYPSTNELKQSYFMPKKLPEPWQVDLGHYLFFGGNDWGQEKALLHSSPDYMGENNQNIRILDVYDCFPK